MAGLPMPADDRVLMKRASAKLRLTLEAAAAFTAHSDRPEGAATRRYLAERGLADR